MVVSGLDHLVHQLPLVTDEDELQDVIVVDVTAIIVITAWIFIIK